MLPDYAALANIVQQWALTAGVPVDHVALSYRDRAVLVLPLNHVSTPAPDDEERPRGRALSRCVLDILATLREAGKPLTETKLLEALAKAGYDWSRTHVERHIKGMMADGTLENVQEGRQRGYRVLE
jgi:hypothetical protein